jgi:hypothetical protein
MVEILNSQPGIAGDGPSVTIEGVSLAHHGTHHTRTMRIEP